MVIEQYACRWFLHTSFLSQGGLLLYRFPEVNRENAKSYSVSQFRTRFTAISSLHVPRRDGVDHKFLFPPFQLQ